jgi:hypothetical protein
MTAKRGPVKPEPGRPSLSSEFELRYTSGFERSLEDLGAGVAPRVAALVSVFFAAWQAGRHGNEALVRKWDLKGLRGSEARKYRVQQIDVLRDYRIWFTVSGQQPVRLWLLEVARRTTTIEVNQRAAIQRAKGIWRSK